MQERRSQARMLCADMVQVRWKDQSGRPHSETALLEDISPTGACLQFETAVPAGVPVTLHCSGARLRGVVRYCVYRDIGWFAGIQFDPGTPWSRASFEPDHLLDLEDLARRAARRKRRTG